MHTNLKTVSGCATRLTVTVTAPEGADKTLTAYCRCCGDSHPATVEGDTVTFPPLPAGEHLFELRAGGVPVIHGHLIARLSAFPVPPMHTVDHTVTADLDGTTVANLSVTLNQGARGPQGPAGEMPDMSGYATANALAAHSEDSTAHVTAGEHAVLANAAQGELWVPGSTGSVTLAGQQEDGVAVSAANNTSRVQVQNSGVTITAPNAPQWQEAGDTPAFYNIRTAKDLTATDASIAAAMATKQDALTAGDGISIDGNVISATTPAAPDLSSYATKADLASSTEYLVTVGSEFAEGEEPVGFEYPYYNAVNDIMGSSSAFPPSFIFNMTITGVAPAGTGKRIAAIRVRAVFNTSGTPARLFLVRSGINAQWLATNSKPNISSLPYFASELLQPSAESCNQDVVLYPCNGEDATFEDLFESSFALGVGESPEAVRFSGANDGYCAYFAIVPRSAGDKRADSNTPYLGFSSPPFKTYSRTPIKFDLVETVKTRQAATNTALAALEARIAALEAAQAGEAET